MNRHHGTAGGALALALGLGIATASGAEAPTIRNDSLEIRCDAASSMIEVRRLPDNAAFVTGGSLGITGGTVRVSDTIHPVFGRGRTIEITGAAGLRGRATLYDGVPFALVQPVFGAAGPGTNLVRSATAFDGAVAAGAPASALKALGTAGLTAVDGHPGSYVFLALADPATRAGVVGAWLTHDRGSGIVFSGAGEGGRATLRAQVDYGRLFVAPGAVAEGEIFAIGRFDDVRDGLERWADLVARTYAVHLPPQPDGYCTWYSSPNGGASDEAHVAELAEFAARELAPFGFRFVQIDDKWQDGVSKNGPNRIFLRHRPNGPYPSGMKAAADRIAKTGLTPGLWFLPFAGTKDDPYFADKLGWFAHGADGAPYETRWGGTAMDMTNPDARAYLADIARTIAKDWGYTYFKMDGLWVGTAAKLLYVNEGYKEDDLGEPLVRNPAVTPIEAYRSGLKLVREAAGSNVFLLGCCVSQNMRSFGGSFGLVDAMRIGPDNGASWGGICRGPWHHANRYFLHGRVWYNDPDPVYVRPSLPLGQARAICSWAGLSGALTVASDWLPGLPPERLDILKRIMPNHGLRPRPADLLDRELPGVWVLRDARPGNCHVVGLFNWDEKAAQSFACGAASLGLPGDVPSWVGFDYWADAFVPPFAGPLAATLPPASCRILALRPADATRPVVVSTSRHVTQGTVDLTGETWDAAKGELSGTSRLVAGDAYELRIVVPVGKDSWEAVDGSLAGAAAATIAVKQAGPQVRARIAPVRGGEAAWTIRFRRAAVDAPAPVTPAGLAAKVGFQSVQLTWTGDATAYRVVRGDNRTSEVATAEFADDAVKAGGDYAYAVSARGWTGAWSAPAIVKASLPARPTLPPAPPEPEVPLSALKAVSAKTGWGKVTMDLSCEGKPLTIEGRRYAKGIGVHAPSTLVYAIPKGMKRFVAVAGLDDEKKSDERSSVAFKIFGDVKEMGEAPVLLGESPVLKSGELRAWHFDVELNDRLREVRLVVEDGGDGIASDHADWAAAGFRK